MLCCDKMALAGWKQIDRQLNLLGPVPCDCVWIKRRQRATIVDVCLIVAHVYSLCPVITKEKSLFTNYRQRPSQFS